VFNIVPLIEFMARSVIGAAQREPYEVRAHNSAVTGICCSSILRGGIPTKSLIRAEPTQVS
jgi:hypothetical protein